MRHVACIFKGRLPLNRWRHCACGVSLRSTMSPCICPWMTSTRRCATCSWCLSQGPSLDLVQHLVQLLRGLLSWKPPWQLLHWRLQLPWPATPSGQALSSFGSAYVPDPPITGCILGETAMADDTSGHTSNVWRAHLQTMIFESPGLGTTHWLQTWLDDHIVVSPIFAWPSFIKLFLCSLHVCLLLYSS